MKDILFKAKRLDNEEWVEGDYVRTFEGKLTHGFIWVPMDSEFIGVKEFEVNPETVCQYTGLKDKNDVKIFENDIVDYSESEHFHGTPCPVLFDKEKGHYFIDRSPIHLCGILFGCGIHKKLEVIGNVYDKE